MKDPRAEWCEDELKRLEEDREADRLDAIAFRRLMMWIIGVAGIFYAATVIGFILWLMGY